MLTIEAPPLGKSGPYSRNARTHSGEQVAQIAPSIAEFDFVDLVGNSSFGGTAD